MKIDGESRYILVDCCSNDCQYFMAGAVEFFENGDLDSKSSQSPYCKRYKRSISGNDLMGRFPEICKLPKCQDKKFIVGVGSKFAGRMSYQTVQELITIYQEDLIVEQKRYQDAPYDRKIPHIITKYQDIISELSAELFNRNVKI